ncbi:MAG: NAD(P)H-dependent oxidoreductase [Oscillospiraceae bacterium]
MDAHRIALRDALLSQKDYGAEMFRYAQQFAAAEQIVLSAPLWDLSFPAQLKISSGKHLSSLASSLRYSEAGLPVGLCRAKKLYYVSTSGGPYDPRFGFDQLRAMATENFGIPEAELVKAELLDIDGCDPEAILHKAMADYGLTETTDK